MTQSPSFIFPLNRELKSLNRPEPNIVNAPASYPGVRLEQRFAGDPFAVQSVLTGAVRLTRTSLGNQDAPSHSANSCRHSVSGGDLLQTSHLPEPSHSPLPPSEW